MAVPQNKAELLCAITINFDRLMKDLFDVPEEQANYKDMEGHAAGTVMSLHDLIAYLTGWNELVLKWLAQDQAGIATDFPETGYKWNDLGGLAQKFYRDYQDLPYAELLARLGRAKDAIIHEIEARDDDTLYGQGWYGKWTMGRMIQFNSSSPYANARTRMRAWKKSRAII
ncbi:MAG: ClbS/DfsB family four-helix bundle protein [Sphingobium sp.]|nr:ClbS/DfsB family four-helix bundle protein [Sphingobium sp.]